MTLLHCVACGDMLRLIGEERRCRCLRSRGVETDGRIEIHGPVRVVELKEGTGDGHASATWGGWQVVSGPHANVRRAPVPPLL